MKRAAQIVPTVQMGGETEQEDRAVATKFHLVDTVGMVKSETVILVRFVREWLRIKQSAWLDDTRLFWDPLVALIALPVSMLRRTEV
jgi:hypothetical protein